MRAGSVLAEVLAPGKPGARDERTKVTADCEPNIHQDRCTAESIGFQASGADPLASLASLGLRKAAARKPLARLRAASERRRSLWVSSSSGIDVSRCRGSRSMNRRAPTLVRPFARTLGSIGTHPGPIKIRARGPSRMADCTFHELRERPARSAQRNGGRGLLHDPDRRFSAPRGFSYLEPPTLYAGFSAVEIQTPGIPVKVLGHVLRNIIPKFLFSNVRLEPSLSGC